MDGIIERLLGFLDTGKPFVTAEAVIQARHSALLPLANTSGTALPVKHISPCLASPDLGWLPSASQAQHADRASTRARMSVYTLAAGAGSDAAVSRGCERLHRIYIWHLTRGAPLLPAATATLSSPEACSPVAWAVAPCITTAL